MRSSDARLHVVAAAVVDGGRVLVARRPRGVHQGGLLEFPGGKLEPGEETRAGLLRELEEELGIKVTGLRPLVSVPHDYADSRLLLDVWLVERWEGQARGAEGQSVEWRDTANLDPAEFPEANRAVIKALRLPALYLITPEPADEPDGGLEWLRRRLAGGAVRLVQLRSKRLEEKAWHTLIPRVVSLCSAHDARVLVNGPFRADLGGAAGVHLTARRLMECARRPLGDDKLVGASCHDAEELRQACRIGVDFAVLSPVAATASHPGARPLGWKRFAALTAESDVPVYALGGMSLGDTETAWQHGAQGIATIGGADLLAGSGHAEPV